MLMEPAWSDMLAMDTDRLDIFANLGSHFRA